MPYIPSLKRITTLPTSAYPLPGIQAPIMSEEEVFVSNLEQLGLNRAQIDTVISLRENGVEVELNAESIKHILKINQKLNSFFKTVNYFNLQKQLPNISIDDALEVAEILRPHQIKLYISLSEANHPHADALGRALKAYPYQALRYEHIALVKLTILMQMRLEEL